MQTLNNSGTVNALHVFDNGDFIAVGDNSYYQHFAKQQNNSYLSFNYPNGLPVNTNFYDIAFYDRMLGVVVGENGAYYKTSQNAVSPLGYLTSTSWQNQTQLAQTDTVLDFANGELPTIYSVAFPSPTSVVIGGENPQNLQNSPIYPYVRQIDDAGGRYSKRMYYDRLGRVAVSQNARQEKEHKFSYTLYDALGRTVEAGEKTENPQSEMQFKAIFGAVINGFENPKTIDDAKLKAWIEASGERREVTKSYYDSVQIATADLQAISSDFDVNYPLQLHRIIHTTFEEVFDNDDATYDHATHFAYDIHGNVKTLVQDNQKMAVDYPSLASERYKRMDYVYDLISGNVHRMSVQTGEADQWHHAYIYDADNRLTDVYTNTHAPLTSSTAFMHDLANELAHNTDWQHDAKYYYYDHGPLARIELGENALQGVDYFYTLQGWLKGVNSSVLNNENDPGLDSKQNSVNAYFAKDVFGFSLHYFGADYKAISGSTSSPSSPVADVNNNSHAAQNSSDLYNGNIRYMQTALTNPLDRTKMPMLNAYEYDQLNRLKTSRSYENGLSNNTWNPTSYNNSYFNAFEYDGMGNITSQIRHNRNGDQFDDLSYKYQKDGNGNLQRNRLYHVNDAIASSLDSTDIDDMGTFVSAVNQINTDNNYSYDAEGRLVKDKQEEIDTILWTVTGKVREIHRVDTSKKKNLVFDYDAFGRRIAKHIYNNQTSMLEKSTYYILDASGNQLSIYEHKIDTANNAATYYLTERNIYGSSRLGVTHDTINMHAPTLLPSYGIVGNRTYELSNHLGNVLTVINDIKYPVSDDNVNISGFEVGITGISDYSPFGAPLDGRTVGSSSRNGFNGQERDDEVSGKGNSYSAEFWQYSPRLGKRWERDPVVKPYESPYAVFNGSPVYFADPDGNDGIASIQYAKDKVNRKNKITQEAGSKKNPHILTIEANYYYNAEAMVNIGGVNELNNAIDAYNKSNFKVIGDDGQYYLVKFKLKAIPKDDLSYRDLFSNFAEKDKINNHRYGNVIDIDIDAPIFKKDKAVDDALGAASGAFINIKHENIKNEVTSNHANLNNTLFNVFIHEIGHNLGGAHIDGGAMNNSETIKDEPSIRTNDIAPTIYRTNRNKLTEHNIKGIINTIWDKSQQGRPGTINLIKNEK